MSLAVHPWSSFVEGVGASSVTQAEISAYEIHSQLLVPVFRIFLPDMSFLTGSTVQCSFFFCYDARHRIDTLFISLKKKYQTEPRP